MSEHWILVGKKVKPVGLMEWAEWYETAERHVGNDKIGEVFVSTVFLGIDHSFGGGKPLLFETMIFGGKRNEYQERCSTYNEAVEMHKKALDLVKSDEVRANTKPKRKLAKRTK